MVSRSWDPLAGCRWRGCDPDDFLRRLLGDDAAMARAHGASDALLRDLRRARDASPVERAVLYERLFLEVLRFYRERHRGDWTFARFEDVCGWDPAGAGSRLHEILTGAPLAPELAALLTPRSGASSRPETPYATNRPTSHFAARTAWTRALTKGESAAALAALRPLANEAWLYASNTWWTRGAAGTRFRDVAAAWGLPGAAPSLGASFGDFDGDGRPDLSP